MVKMKEAKDAEPIENKAEEQPKKKMVTRMKPVASSRLANSRSTKHLAAQAARALRNNREVVNSTTNRETRADSNKKGGANAPTFADDFTVESYDQSFDQTTMRDDESLSSEYTADSSEFNTRTFLSESFSSSMESTDSYDGEREDSSRMTTDNRGLSAEDDFDRELDGLVSELTRGMPSVVWEDQEAETEDDSLADKSKNKTHKQVIEEGKEKSYESNGVGDTGKLAGKEKAWMAYENKTANSSSVKDWPEDEQPLLASTNTSESEGMEYFKDARESHKETPYQDILSIEKKSVETDVASKDELRCDRPEAKEREIDGISCLQKQSPLLPEVAPTSQETKTAKKYKFYESDSRPVSPKRSHSKNKNKDTNITELEKSGDAVSVSSEDKSQKPTSPRKFSSHDKKAVERSPRGAQLDSIISKSNDRFPGVNVLSGIDLNADKLSMKSEIMVISEIDSSSPTKRPYSMAPLQRTPPEIKHTLDEMDMIYPVVASPIKLSHTFDVAPEGVLRFTSLSKQKRPPMIGSNETEEPPADNADLELELEKGSYSDDETHSQENRYPEYIIEKMKEPNEQLKGLIDVAINDQSGSRRMNACGAFKQLSGVNKRNALSLAWTQGVLVAHATVLKDLQASEQELNRTLTSLLSILRVPQNRRIVLATPFMAEGLTKCVNHVSPQIFVKAGHCIEALSHEKRNRPLLPRNTSMMQALCSRLHEYTTMDKTRKQTEETLKDMGLKDKSSFDPDKSAGIDTIAKSILNVFLELSKVLDVSYSLSRVKIVMEVLMRMSDQVPANLASTCNAIFSNLTQNPRSSQHLVFAVKDFVTTIVASAACDNADRKRYAFFAIQNLSCDAKCRLQLGKTPNLLQTLADGCKGYDDLEAQASALSAMNNLTKEQDNLIYFTNNECMGNLLGMAGDKKVPHLQYLASDALVTLAHWMQAYTIYSHQQALNSPSSDKGQMLKMHTWTE